MKKILLFIVLSLSLFSIKVSAIELKTGITLIDNDDNKVISLSDELCIKNDCFYVMSNDNGNLRLLTKYNLYTGGKFPASEKTTDSTKWIAYENPTSLQTEIMKGYVTGVDYYEGVTAFNTLGTAKYWKDETSYPVYVYSSNTVFYESVEKYVTHLKDELSYDDITGKLLSYEDAIALGCTPNTGYVTSCKEAPSWLYSTSYWLGTAYSNIAVYHLSSSGNLSGVSWDNSLFGVRPVIELNEDILYQNSVYINSNIENDNNITFERINNVIKLNVLSKEGYEIESITVTDASGNIITLTNNEFTINDSDVTVKVNYKKIESTTANTEETDKDEESIVNNPDTGNNYSILLSSVGLLFILSLFGYFYLKKYQIL